MIDPLTRIDPEIETELSEANIRFERFKSSAPFPTIKAPAVELVALYLP